MNILDNYGLPASINVYIINQGLEEFNIGRITQQHRDSYQVITEEGLHRAIITGNLRYSANSKLDLPIVGDWITLIPSEDTYLIYNVLPRQTILQRQEVASKSDVQPIAANMDFALIVQSIDQNFNVNRLERYVTICHSGKIVPIILLNKIDLITSEELTQKINTVKARLEDINIICTSTMNETGLNALKASLRPGKSYGLIGSSGVGKSSIINGLLGEDRLKTRALGSSHGKGKHTTTHRELILLPSGSILIDTPGMREVGIAESTAGISSTFDNIEYLAEQCQFADCTHVDEPNCAIQSAIENGDLDPAVLNNFLKLKRETARFTMSKMEKRKKAKNLGKMYKSIIAEKKKRKF